jgi:hypothetical protein
MPVKWLEAEEIDKSFTSNILWWNLIEQGGSIDAFRLAHDILAYNHEKKGLQILIKPISKVTYKQKWRKRGTWH